MSEPTTNTTDADLHDHGASTAAADFDWEQRYADSDGIWSGEVNGSLVVETADLPRGAALDIGCGEGADAIWLAEQGWQVTAVDVSPTAVERGRRAATERQVEVQWHAIDLLGEPPSEQFDLVTLHYPAFPIEQAEAVVRLLTGSVKPGGLLLVVGHAPPDDPENAPFDPSDWTLIPDIAPAIDPSWTIELHEIRPRPGDHHRDSPHSHDEIFRARKPA